MKRVLVALAAGAAFLGLSLPSAQAQVRAAESRHWLVPNQADNTPCCDGANAQQMTISAFNVGAREARVQFIPVGPNGATVTRLAGTATIAPGATTTTGYGKAEGFSYVLVVSSEPVIVTTRALRGTTLAQQPGQSGQQLPGNVFNGSNYVGRVTTWNTRMQVDGVAYAIDCAGAEAGHFACSKSPPSQVNAGNTGPRPNTNAPAVAMTPQPGVIYQQATPKPQ